MLEYGSRSIQVKTEETMACCAFADTVDHQFTPRLVARELAQYRRRGAGPTARLLRDLLEDAHLTAGSVIDVGGGIGALAFDLLARGAARATIVEASVAFANAARTEADRLRRTGIAAIVTGDFVEIAADLAPADVVTLDRVVCCYPMYQPLLAAAASRATRAIAFSYPRDRWVIRAGMDVQNWCRSCGSRFRTFLHDATAMRLVLGGAGFALADHRQSYAWRADLFVRNRRGLVVVGGPLS
jgi:magnesium-protoporphyrin O-methyltransferase